MAVLTIGRVAARTGLRASAIRYYEAQGLLAAAARHGGKRVYEESIFQRIAVIELAKTAGFSLSEIRDLLTKVEGGAPATTWKTITRARRAGIDHQMFKLTVMKRILAKLERCTCRSLDDCGHLFALALAKQSGATRRGLAERYLAREAEGLKRRSGT